MHHIIEVTGDAFFQPPLVFRKFHGNYNYTNNYDIKFVQIK